MLEGMEIWIEENLIETGQNWLRITLVEGSKKGKSERINTNTHTDVFYTKQTLLCLRIVLHIPVRSDLDRIAHSEA